MTSSTNWDIHLDALLQEPSLAPFAQNGALVVWSSDGASILHTNSAGSALLAEPLADEGLDRLRSLAVALAPSAGVRLERLVLIEGGTATDYGLPADPRPGWQHGAADAVPPGTQDIHQSARRPSGVAERDAVTEPTDLR